MSAITEDTCSCNLPKTSTGAFTATVEFDVDGMKGGETTTGYAIYTPAQLQHLALHLNSNAVLMNDLDFSQIATGSIDASTPMGALKIAREAGIYTSGHVISNFESGKFVPIGCNSSDAYTGNFYGNEKTITGLIISGGTVDYVGLFGCISGAAIKDLICSGGAISGFSNVGGVVGSNSSSGKISNSYNTGAVSGSSNVGGVVGCNYSEESSSVVGYWLEGTNVKTDIGIGSGSGTTTTFSAIDSTLSSIYTSMSAIKESAGTYVDGAINKLDFSSNHMLPSYFNELQGSYITSEGSLTLTINAISATTLTMATGAALGTLITAGGSEIPPTGGTTYDVSSLDKGTWILIKAINTDPMYNRIYTIYKK